MRVGLIAPENPTTGDQLSTLVAYQFLESKGHFPTVVLPEFGDYYSIAEYCDVSSIDHKGDFDYLVDMSREGFEPIYLASAAHYMAMATMRHDDLANYINEVSHTASVAFEDRHATALFNLLTCKDDLDVSEKVLTAQTYLLLPSVNTSEPSEGDVCFKIQNLMLPDCEWKDEHWWMMYKGEKMEYVPVVGNTVEHWVLQSGSVEFLTYFNSLTVRKWSKYSHAKSYKLRLKIKGNFTIQFFGNWLTSDGHEKPLDERLVEISQLNIQSTQKRRYVWEQIYASPIREERFSEMYFTNDNITEIELPVMYQNSTTLSFTIKAETPCEIYDGAWYAVVEEKQINPVNISLCTTTFKKEEFILPNLEMIKNDVFGVAEDKREGMDALADHFYVNVVDNGCTLSKSDVEASCISLYPNPNTGGAGGFTRGMIETSRLRENGAFDATHVLFMDDDVQILPESLKRTFSLLSLLKEEFNGRFISGAMLDISQKNEQYEDLGFVTDYMAMFQPVKPRFALHIQRDVLLNEESYPLENRYASWWYCCVPAKYATPDSLSLPIFYRGDDIEFSLRNNPGFITLGGICVWHLAFNTKVTSSLEFYMVIRNALITKAISGIMPHADFVGRIKHLYGEEIRKFHYAACNHLLDALDDFMKGPKYIASLNGEVVMRTQGAKNEPMQSVDSFGFEVDINSVYKSDGALSPDDMKLFIETDNGHTLPEYVLRKPDIPPTVPYMFAETPTKQYMQKRLMAVNIHNRTAALRVMDKGLYAELEERRKMLFERYEKEKKQIEKNYCDYSKHLHSFEFWNEYLSMKQ